MHISKLQHCENKLQIWLALAEAKPHQTGHRQRKGVDDLLEGPCGLGGTDARSISVIHQAACQTNKLENASCTGP